MDWKRVTVYTTAEALEAVYARLDMLGISQVEVLDDAAGMQAFLADTARYWDYVDESVTGEKQPGIRFLVKNDEVGEALLLRVRGSLDELKGMDIGIDAGSLEISTEPVCDEDWENNWRQYFHPIPVGERLIVCPAWEELPECGDRTPLLISATSSFGTGDHATTQLCLAALEKSIRGGENVADIGCGSGILSAGALLLGAKHVTAVDIDPNSLKNTLENIAVSGLDADDIDVFTGDILCDGDVSARFCDASYDIVAANIVADVIIALLPTVRRIMKPDGTFVASGIITERLTDVLAAAAAAGFSASAAEKRDGWAAVTFGMNA